MPDLQVVLRYVVFAAFAASVLVALASWLVRTRRISPFAALVVRVIAGWFGYFRYTRWIRPAYALTDWLVEPIRRVLPIAGGFDWSPLAAWLVLVVLKGVLLGILVG